MLTIIILLIGQPPVTGPFSLACAASLLVARLTTVLLYVARLESTQNFREFPTSAHYSKRNTKKS